MYPESGREESVLLHFCEQQRGLRRRFVRKLCLGDVHQRVDNGL